MSTKQKQQRRLRIKRRIRKRLSAGTAERPRMTVYRSNTAMYVQLVDDTKGTTLLSANTKKLSSKKSINIEDATALGKVVAEKATAQGITTVVFDRNGYLFHGKVKAVADAAREGGLNF